MDSNALNWEPSLGAFQPDRNTAFGFGQETDPALPELRAPQIPGYEIQGALGRGGMGVVYQARHVALNRVVALKVIRGGAHASVHDLARFRAEAEAVAKLSHPHIVQVFDVGVHDGLPYCALELLTGGSLDHRLKGKPQPPRAAATLIGHLARAIQAAHAQGIIHRDLKPSNILLTADGSPKIADFGLAKQVADDSGATRTGDVVGTPAYMSPEQATGQVRDVGPAADIYALGTILYEMLTGRQPFQGLSPTDVILQVAQQEPVPPSRLQPALPRDLETICLHCLRKEPSRRYPSAAALADDLERFLSDQPITARPVSPWERGWRWCRRNPLAAVLATSVLLMGLTLAVGGPMMALREARLRQEAEDQKRNAEQARGEALRDRDRAEESKWQLRAALDAMTSQVASDWLATQKELRPEHVRFLEQAVVYYRQFAAEVADDPRERLQVAKGNHQLGGMLHRLGKQTEAETAYRQALTLLEGLVAEFPKEPQYREEQATVTGRLALLLHKTGRLHEAEAAYRHNIAIFTELTRTAPAWPQLRQNLATGYGNLALLLAEKGEKVAAAEYHRQAEELFTKLAEESPQEAIHRRNLAASCGNRGILLREMGRWNEADAVVRHSLDLRRKLAAEMPGNPAAQFDLIAALQIVGDHYHDNASVRAADQALREAVTLSEQLVAEYPTLPEYRHLLGLSLNKHCLVLIRMGNWTEAEAVLRRALTVRERLVAEHPDRMDYRFTLAGCRSNLGMVLAGQNHREEAIKAYDAALEMQEDLVAKYPGNHTYRQELAITHTSVGGLLRDQKLWEEAEKHLRRALEVREQLVADLPKSLNHRRQLSVSWNELGLLYALVKDRAKAGEAHRRSIAIQEAIIADFPKVVSLRLDLGGSYCNYGNNLRFNGRPAESLSWYAKAITLLEDVLAEEPKHAFARKFLRNSHAARAGAFDELKRHLAATPDWGRAVALDDQKIALFRQKFSESQSKALEQLRLQAKSDPSVAGDKAVDLARTPGLPAEVLIDLARLCAAATQATADDTARRERHAAQAVALLHQARRAGAFTEAAQAKQLREDADWAPLRQRSDFQTLLQGLP